MGKDRRVRVGGMRLRWPPECEPTPAERKNERIDLEKERAI